MDGETDGRILPPGKWMEAHRIALGTARIAAFPRTAPVTGYLNGVLAPLGEKFGVNPEDAARPYFDHLFSMPPATLEGLCALNPAILGRWSYHRRHWENALRELKWNGKISPIAGAKLIANRIASGGLSSAQIIRLVRNELGVSWSNRDELLFALSELIRKLSQRFVRSAEKLAAIADFRSATAQPPRWQLIENALLQHAYSWPLLVFSDQDGQDTYCTLPVVIDVHFDYANEVYITPTDIVVNCPDLLDSAHEALRAAKSFWRSKATSWNFQYQRRVWNCSIQIDLRAADEIVRPFFGSPPVAKLAGIVSCRTGTIRAAVSLRCP
jgi:hypothetical protein